MKHTLATLSCLIAFLAAGCGSLPFAKNPTTRSAGGLFHRQTIVHTNDAGAVLTNTLVTVNPAVTRSLDTARDIVTMVPTPWSPVVAGGLAVLSGVLGLIAKKKSDKAALVPALIAGVEAANNADVKNSIRTIATAVGVQPLLDRHVQRLTE